MVDFHHPTPPNTFWSCGVQMLLSCISPCVLQHWGSGYSSSSLEIFHNTKIYGIFKGMESLSVLVSVPVVVRHKNEQFGVNLWQKVLEQVDV